MAKRNGKDIVFGYYNGKLVLLESAVATSTPDTPDTPTEETEQLTAPTISLDGSILTMTATDDRTEQFVIFVDGVEMTTVEAITPTEGLAYELSSNGTYYACTGIGTAIDTDIVIASEIDGIPVTRVSGFTGNTSIKSVIIPNSVTSIGTDAFRNCTALDTIVIGNSVKQMNYNPFVNTGYYNNANNWLDNVLYIGEYLVASKDDNLGVCTVKDGTKHIATYAFRTRTSLTEIVIPDTVEIIGIQTFFETSLTSLVIPNSVTYIGDQAFRCPLLESISFNGTKEQWNAISKDSNWNYSVPATYVQCTDGTVSL